MVERFFQLTQVEPASKAQLAFAEFAYYQYLANEAVQEGHANELFDET